MKKLGHTIQTNKTLNDIIQSNNTKRYEKHVEDIERYNQPFRQKIYQNVNFSIHKNSKKDKKDENKPMIFEQSFNTLNETSEWIVDPKLKPIRDELVDEIVINKSQKFYLNQTSKKLSKSSQSIKKHFPSLNATINSSNTPKKDPVMLHPSNKTQIISTDPTNAKSIDKLVSGFKVLNNQYSMKRLNEKADRVMETVKKSLVLMKMIEVIHLNR